MAGPTRAGTVTTRSELPTELPPAISHPAGFRDPRVVLPGIVAVSGPPVTLADSRTGDPANSLRRLCEALAFADHPLSRFPLAILCDDSRFAAANVGNFLWVTFTRSNPAADVDGAGASTIDKHWGCRGPLVIDARVKPHHAPPLEEDPAVVRRIESLAARDGPLAGL